MIPDSSQLPGPDRLLSRLKNEYLKRLARFALIDDVPAPWSSPLPEHAGNTVEKNNA